MKVSDNPPKIVDEVIVEVRAIKREISERHGNDINRLLESLISQERASGIRKAEHGDSAQPAAAVDPKSEDCEKVNPEADGNSK